MGEQSNRPQNAPFRFLSLLSSHRLRDIFHIPTANGPRNTFPTCVLPLSDGGKEGKCQCFPFYATSSSYSTYILWHWVVQERMCHEFYQPSIKKSVQGIFSQEDPKTRCLKLKNPHPMFVIVTVWIHTRYYNFSPFRI